MIAQRHRRPRIRYSLRVLFVIVTGVSVGAALFAGRLQQAHQQQAMVAKIHHLGGEVGYNGELITPGPPPKPTVFRRLLGDDFFDRATFVYLHSSRVTNDDLALFSHCRSIEGINLGCTSITDDGLIHLRDMTWLKKVYLTRTPVTDAGLVHLRGLHSLQELSLDYKNVSAEAVSHLRKALPDATIEHH